jgi:aerobic carbon-monoxide dehydrogenase medium subunit
VKAASFEYHAPASAKEAVELLADLGDGAKLIAGGQSLVPLLALRLAAFEHLVDVRKIPGLRGIEDRGATTWIGAGTTQAVIGGSSVVAARVPLLARATPLIGHFQIRNRGTIGGSLAHAEAAAEYPAVALALDAEMETLSPRGRRAIPAAEFFTGIWDTALEPDELLTGITFAVPAGPAGHAVEEFARRPGDFALAGAAVTVELDPAGGVPRVRRCAIALFGLGPTPLRAAAAEAAVTGAEGADVRTDPRAEEVGRAAMADLESVPYDLHGSAAYRKRVGASVVATAWRRAVADALGEEEEASG